MNGFNALLKSIAVNISTNQYRTQINLCWSYLLFILRLVLFMPETH